MSKLSNLLNMYFLIQSRGLIKVSELAEILELSPRTIKSYKDDLEMAGIYLGSKPGRNGGYFLENKMNLNNLVISPKELDSLKMANEIIRSGNYIFATDFEILASKLINHKDDFKKLDFFTKEYFRPGAMQEKEKEYWATIQRSILNKKKLVINYSSLGYESNQPKETRRVIHPYGSFNHEGSLYVFGYCELRSNIRYFKLPRINNLKLLNEKFEIKKKYNLKGELRKSFGIVDDESFDLKLKIKYPMSQIVKERQYLISQKIKDIGEGEILFEAHLKGYEELKQWVFSMGSYVEVIEPVELKEDIIKEITKIQKIYNHTSNLHQ